MLTQICWQQSVRAYQYQEQRYTHVKAFCALFHYGILNGIHGILT